jgi:hypothetical protein
MRFLVSALIIQASLFSHALSTSDILSRVQKNEISFDRGSYMNLQGQILDTFIKIQKSKYPKFTENMAFSHQATVGSDIIIISYDWVGNECVLVKLDKNKKQEDIKKDVTEKRGGISYKYAEIIPLKICEKLYSFYSK